MAPKRKKIVDTLSPDKMLAEARLMIADQFNISLDTLDSIINAEKGIKQTKGIKPTEESAEKSVQDKYAAIKSLKTGDVVCIGYDSVVGIILKKPRQTAAGVVSSVDNAHKKLYLMELPFSVLSTPNTHSFEYDRIESLVVYTPKKKF